MKRIMASVYQASSIPAFQDSDLLDGLSMAYADIQAKMRLGQTRITGDLVSGTDYYTIPVANSSGNRSPRFGRQLRVYVRPESGDGVPVLLQWKDPAWMMANFDMTSTTNNTGFPLFWMETDVPPLGRIQVRPVPNFSRTGGIEFMFIASPNETFAIYNQTAITATFTYGSTAVTFSSDPSPNVVQGYEIGVPPLVQLDGTPQYDAMPTNWVPIASISGVNATLAWEWPNLSGAGQTFIAANVQNLDQILPGGLERLPSMLGAQYLLETYDPEKAIGLAAQTDRMLAKLNLDQSAMNMGRFRRPELWAPSALTGGDGGYTGNRYGQGGWY
jgi:hypothetical protein